MPAAEAYETAPPPLAFPPGFLWGAATASYQIEGGAASGGRGPSWWDDFSHEPGRTHRGQSGDVACDHFHRLEADVQLMVDAGLQAYRFSISWSRVWPDGTASSENAEGVAWYKRLLTLLRERGIKAVATLYHWDLPSALAARGGWLSADSPGWFEDYAGRCYELFDADVSMWVTFNEPWCVCALGYGSGTHAPGRCSQPGTEPYLAGHHVLLAHARAYRRYKAAEGPPAAQRSSPIGIVLNAEWREPATSAATDEAARVRELDFTLGWFAEPIFLSGDYPTSMRDRVGDRLPRFDEEQRAMLRGSSDFFGFNWYSARMTAAATPWRLLAALPSLLRMGMAEPGGLCGLLVGQLRARRRQKREDAARRRQEATTRGEEEPAAAAATREATPRAGATSYFGDMGVVPSFRRSWALTAMGWPIVPWAFARMLRHISATYTPAGGIYITENGLAVRGEDDVAKACDVRPGKPGAKRIAYVRSHLVAMHRAIEEGHADVRGYFLWSLMDNFEWAYGYSKRFGAYHVDYKRGLVRTPKPVVPWYRGVIEANAVAPEAEEAALDVWGKRAVDARCGRG